MLAKPYYKIQKKIASYHKPAEVIKANFLDTQNSKENSKPSEA